jgi:hypothetical protein
VLLRSGRQRPEFQQIRICTNVVSRVGYEGRLSCLPDESRYAFEVVLVEPRVTRVLAGLANDGDETCEDCLVGRREALSSRDDDTHNT